MSAGHSFKFFAEIFGHLLWALRAKMFPFKTKGNLCENLDSLPLTISVPWIWKTIETKLQPFTIQTKISLQRKLFIQIWGNYNLIIIFLSWVNNLLTKAIMLSLISAFYDESTCWINQKLPTLELILRLYIFSQPNRSSQINPSISCSSLGLIIYHKLKT